MIELALNGAVLFAAGGLVVQVRRLSSDVRELSGLVCGLVPRLAVLEDRSPRYPPVPETGRSQESADNR